MAAAIGGSTGAVLTGIIMLTEMTKDHSIMLPLVITCSVAYAVRKGIMDESIYTMKLRARGHTVPEGLHASVLTSERIRDVMTTDFTVVPSGDDVPPGASIVVHSDNSMISGVTRPEDAQAGSDGNSLRYVVMPEQAMLLAAAVALLDSEAEIILVSLNPDSLRTEDLVGVVTPMALAHLLKADEELS
jgi:CIC family chloride channel protein